MELLKSASVPVVNKAKFLVWGEKGTGENRKGVSKYTLQTNYDEISSTNSRVWCLVGCTKMLSLPLCALKSSHFTYELQNKWNDEMKTKCCGRKVDENECKERREEKMRGEGLKENVNWEATISLRANLLNECGVEFNNNNNSNATFEHRSKSKYFYGEFNRWDATEHMYSSQFLRTRMIKGNVVH